MLNLKSGLSRVDIESEEVVSADEGNYEPVSNFNQVLRQSKTSDMSLIHRSNVV